MTTDCRCWATASTVFDFLSSGVLLLLPPPRIEMVIADWEFNSEFAAAAFLAALAVGTGTGTGAEDSGTGILGDMIGLFLRAGSS